MNSIDISIIIVSYNQFRLLWNCLDSVKRFTTGIIYEVIVVDNGSDEGNVSDVIKEFHNIKLIQNESNRGFSAANNQGAEIASGKYLLFLNNDTVLTENTLKIVYDFCESQPGEIIAGIKLLNQDGSMQESVYDYTTLWNSFTENFFLYKIFPRSSLFNKYYQNHLHYDKAVEAGVVKGAFLFITAASFKKLGGFDERFFFYAEELDLCYRFHKKSGKVYYYPLTSIIHIGGATTSRNLWFQYRNLTTAKIQFYQKHFRGMKFAAGILFHYTGLLLRSALYLAGGVISFNRNLVIKSYYFFRQLCVYPKNVFKEGL